jgi:hypothetical protein
MEMNSCGRQLLHGSAGIIDGDKYAVIEGRHVPLPYDARFYFQDKRGCWYWSSRKPRVKGDDWTPNKSPVQVHDEKGFPRCLITPARQASDAWRNTVTQVICAENMPLAVSR